jgi:acetyl-CoA carboxylase biotin carboxyl carrier protein
MSHLDLRGLDAARIHRLLECLSGTDVEECEIQQGDFSISLKRSTFGHATMASERGEQPARTEESMAAEERSLVPAPAVGIFHRAEKQSGAPSVQEGARVKPGDVLGMIEVIGVPHPIRSTSEGTVESFLVEDGQAVEYGQPIVAISE